MSQNHDSVQQDLFALQHRIHLAARDRKQPLDHLMPWLVEDANLVAAWDRVRRADGAHTAGLDGVTCDDIGASSAAWLAAIRNQIMAGTYAFEAPRWVDVPKKANDPAAGTRRLGILTVRDRVVHGAIKQVLEPIFEPLFAERSFGFRPGRSVPSAIMAACNFASTLRSSPSAHAWAVRMDVANCFDTIDHHHLLTEIRRQVQDVRFDALMTGLLATMPRQPRRWWLPRSAPRGIVQGSSLSALLCNIALNNLDHVMAMPGGLSMAPVALFRYADDMLLIAADRRAAQAGVRTVRRLLHIQRQELKRGKQHDGSINNGVEWLGVRIGPRERSGRLLGRLDYGYTVPDRQVRQIVERIDELTAPPSSRLDNDVFDPSRWLVSINTQLRQWAQAYCLADDAAEVFRMIDDHTRRQTAHLLRRITGLSMRDLHRIHRLRLSRGFWTWHVNGARLVQLAILAPRQFDPRRRRPPWYASPARRQQHGAQLLEPAT